MLCWTLRKDNCGPGSPPPSPNKYPRIKTRPPSLRPTLAVLLRTQSLRKRSRREGANTNDHGAWGETRCASQSQAKQDHLGCDRGARRGPCAWLWRRSGAGQTLGAGSAGPRPRAEIAVPSAQEARDRWRCNSVSEYDDAPTNEELEWIAVRWRARYAEPKWGTP